MRTSLTALGAAVLTVTACAKRPVPLAPTPEPQPSAQDDAAAARAEADSAARADSLRRAALARQRAEEDSARAALERAQQDPALSTDAMKVLTETVYFDYDQSVLTDSAKALLSAKVPILQANKSLKLRITGHTDELGSSEYNLALGLRRAAEAKAYLVANGVDGSRIKILSMGEEQPAVQGSGEPAWAKNRRAEFAPASATESGD